MPKPKEYSASHLKKKDGFDAIRENLWMYLGGYWQEWLVQAAYEIFSNSVDEALAGHAKNVVVTLKDKDTVEISDDGRGFPVGMKKSSDPERYGSVMQETLETVHMSGKFKDSDGGNSAYGFSGGMHGVGSTAVLAVSSKFKIVSRRNSPSEKGSFSLSYSTKSRGEAPTCDGPISKSVFFSGTGTTVEFSPDYSVFKECESEGFDWEAVAEKIRKQIFLIEGIRITLKNVPAGTEEVLFNEKGIASYFDSVKVRNSDGSESAFNTPVFAGTAFQEVVFDQKTGTYRAHEDDTEKYRASVTPAKFRKWLEDKKESWALFVEVDAAASWANDFDYDPIGDVVSYANSIHTSQGGSHKDGFIEGIRNFLVKSLKADGFKRLWQLEKEPKHALSGLKWIVSVRSPRNHFKSQTKDLLATPYLKPIVKGLTEKILERVLNKTELQKIKKQIVQSMDFAAKVKNAKESVVSNGSKEAKRFVASKLVDAYSKRREDCELFIVEGDSAGNGAISERDGAHQAVLPLRGVVANTFGLTESALLASDKSGVFKSLVYTIGTGIGRHYDHSQLRYGKVVLLCDADSAGYFINSLLILFFWNFMPELVKKGHLYVGLPPLFVATVWQKKHYLRDRKELEKFLKTAKGAKASVTRCKGLGEMQPEELGEACMAPETRNVVKVEWDGWDLSKTMETFFWKSPRAKLAFLEEESAKRLKETAETEEWFESEN